MWSLLCGWSTKRQIITIIDFILSQKSAVLREVRMIFVVALTAAAVLCGLALRVD